MFPATSTAPGNTTACGFPNGKWCWFSRGIGGYSALDYLIKVNGYSFMDAMETITGRAAIKPPSFFACAKRGKAKASAFYHRPRPITGLWWATSKKEESTQG